MKISLSLLVFNKESLLFFLGWGEGYTNPDLQTSSYWRSLVMVWNPPCMNMGHDSRPSNVVHHINKQTTAQSSDLEVVLLAFQAPIALSTTASATNDRSDVDATISTTS